ncbi:Rieske 2Fe-2S domain-containing protein [Dechloromonas sp. HYN0024]|uniref:Rieske (2Fe-2S) protein n=1 Tax=Dechloromonas sp. HYN0024 TaxID=2231055 RepID=UPI001F081FDB|nr:Rieske 2Fe-2S domain-containing protein [Dechloromonas sp. HYN0024]
MAPKFPVCTSQELANGQYRKLLLVFEAKEEECLVLRFDGRIFAYLNRCVHMPRRLDCEEKQIFDQSGRYLRCSMHGIVYTPQTGASVSAMCEGERLHAVDSYEESGVVGIADFRVSSISQSAPPV